MDNAGERSSSEGYGDIMPEQLDQDGYDIFVAQGFKIISKIAKTLEGKASIDQLGNTLFEIVDRIESEGQKSGVDFGLDVILHGSNEILGRMIEVAGVEINEDQIKAVVGIAVGRYVQNAVKTGKMTVEQLQALSQQAQQSMPQAGQTPGAQPSGQPGLLGGA